MKITCESCGAKYTIADDKVRGRKVKIRCKGCGTPIVVDGKQSNGASADAEDDGSLESEAPPALEAATPAGNDLEWSVNLSETDQRTLTTQQIVDAWRAGTLTADAYVWREGMGDWIPILECSELEVKLRDGGNVAGGAVSSAAAASDARAPSAPNAAARPFGAGGTDLGRPTGAAAARVVPRRTPAAHDLFAGVESAGADGEELATSAPVLPQAGSVRPPPGDANLTGARNENSVLFSLDALKAGFSGAPAKAEPAPTKDRNRPSAPMASDDPFGMGGASNGVAGIGGNNPLFSLAANQALLTAPPPPEPPPRPVQAVIASGPQPAAPPRSKKTLLGIAGGAVALLAAGLGLGLGLGSDKDKPAAETPESAASAEERESASRREEEAKAEEARKKEAEAAEAEAKAKAAASAEQKPDEAKGDAASAAASASTSADSSGDSKAGVSGKSSSGSTASSTSKREPKEASKKEEAKPAAAGSDQPFSKAAAVTALTAASNQAASCKKIGGPTGTGKVTVTFAPSGRVTSANVNGAPFAGTTVGGCVASVFRKAKVPAFSGNPLTVSKSFTIR